MRASMASLCVCLSLLAACGSNNATSNHGSGGSSASGGSSGADGGADADSGVAGASATAFRVSLSVSPFTGAMFAAGASFSDGALVAKTPAELEALYRAHGANEIYARISDEAKPASPSDDASLATALDRAKLAHDMGLPFNPELGLWQHYGDVTCQPPPDFSDYPSLNLPGSWDTLTIDQMLPVFHDFGALMATRITGTGVTVDVWDIGNEVDFGVAGVAPQGVPGSCSTPYVAPNGVDPAIGQQTVAGLLAMTEAHRIAWLQTHVWPHEAKILAAVAGGITSIVPNARFATHISENQSATFALAFYQAMFDGGFRPDVLGFSFYPSAKATSGRIQNFKDVVTAVQAQFQRPAFVAEFAYPAATITTGAYASWNNVVPNYPLSEDGQAAFIRDFAAWAKSAGLSGLRPWAPDGVFPGWGGLALFRAVPNSPAMARKGLDSIAQGIANPDPNAFHD